MTADTVAIASRPALDLAGLLAPRSIAVVGASPGVDRHPGRAIANLLRTGYPGRIVPVNPKYQDVLGLPCVPSIADAGPVDTAYVLVGADRVLDVTRQCAAAGVAHVVVCTSGFAEEGAAGRAAQAELSRIARSTGTRIVGPNCIGVLSPVDGVIATPTLNIAQHLLPGSVTVVSQSGGMGVNVVNLATARGLGTRALISVGNECDVDVADLVTALAGDPHTSVIALFLEQVRRADAFVAAVRAARDAGKHLVALKVGASDAAARSSLGHTGAMTGSHDVFRTVMAEEDVHVVDSLEALVDVADLLSRGVLPRGDRLLVVSPSGGECSYAADRAEAAGLSVPPLDAERADRLRRLMRFGTPGNPLDLTGAVIGDPVLLRRMLDEATAGDAFDAVLVALPTWSAHDAERLLPVILDAAAATRVPTVVSSWSAGAMTATVERLLQTSRVPTFTDTDAALRALGVVARPRRPRRPAPQPVGTAPPPAWAGRAPTEDAAKRFLAGHGVAVAREVLVAPGGDVLGAAAGLRRPLVAKQLCVGVEHKSDLGLVAVGLRTDDEVRAAVERFAAAVDTHRLQPHGILLAEQATGAEVIVGGVRDPDFGPMVLVGAGGVLTEVFSDRVLARCPVTADEARAMLRGLRIWPVLDGYRGARHDVAALAELISRVSQLLAGGDWIAALDLNPVIVGATGAVAVDAAVHVREA
ncbi:acetate--CoA ligase family protein [Dactylosporangium sp. NPDC050588]|uniref:acetate--CoA ligase family protein n=1 Tax=Dactylosporangium sp. NPDC050588 TaxID=3157211 RepID=UPI0033D8F305